MSVWSNIGGVLSGVAAAAKAAGVTTASGMQSLMNAFGNATNPNESDEIALCKEIAASVGNQAMVNALEQKLIGEIGLPPAAAAIAVTLANPGVDVTAKVLEMEQIIQAGG